MIYPLQPLSSPPADELCNGLAISVRARNSSTSPHTGFLHFGARDRQTTQSIINFTRLLIAQHCRAITDSQQFTAFGIEQTAKMATHTFQAVHTLNVAGVNVR